MRLTTEEWNELDEEQQAEIREESPNSVPETANSEQDSEDSEPKKPETENPVDDDDDNTVVYKGKRIPVENLIGEKLRKATKEKDKDIEELKSLVTTLTQQMKAPKAQVQSDDYWEKEAEKIAGNLVKYDEETGETKANKEAILGLLRLQGNLLNDVRGIEKQRSKEIKSALRKLDKDERELIGGLVEEELDKFPLGQPITAESVERAIVYARGMRHDKYLERTKAEMESNLKKSKKRIEGEVIDDDSFVPATGSKSSGNGPRPTAKQILLAKERGIPVEVQMKIDSKLEKKNKKQEKK